MRVLAYEVDQTISKTIECHLLENIHIKRKCDGLDSANQSHSLDLFFARRPVHHRYTSQVEVK